MKYIHIRRRLPDDTPAPTGGLTIAYTKPKDGFVEISFAVCSDKDNYCKQTGRDKALDRFIQNNKMYFDETLCKTVEDIIYTFEDFFDLSVDLANKQYFKEIKKAASIDLNTEYIVKTYDSALGG